MYQDPVFVGFERFYYEISLCTPCLCGVLNGYESGLVTTSSFMARVYTPTTMAMIEIIVTGTGRGILFARDTTLHKVIRWRYL